MNEEITLQMFINACIIAGLVTWFIYSIIDLAFSETETDNMSNANFIKWIILVSVSVWRIFVSAATWRPKTGIDKEIAEEEKEISELERQKEKMETLEELKRRKERLFNEVHSGTNADCQWCGEDDCLKPAYTVDGIAQYYCTSCHRWLYDGSSMV